MAHFAKIENNKVTEVIVIDNQFENQGNLYINNVLGLKGEWIQTSYNDNFRGNFAGVGYDYNRGYDVFIAPQPYPSWKLDANWKWQPPTPYPQNELLYIWNEDELNWIKL
jgi:hypothetical protein